MLATFRSATFVKAMMWIVAIAFVGLIVLEWGADYSATGGGPTNVIGTINGQEVTHEHFENRLRHAYRVEKSRGVQDPDFGKLIREQWDALISQAIVTAQLERYAIQVSDQEVDFYNRRNPPPEIRNLEFFQTKESFDFAKYHQFLDSPSTYSDPNNKQIVLYAESSARDQLLSSKLQELVAGGVKVSDEEIRQAWRDRKEKVRVEYAGLEASRLADSLVTFDETDLQSYYAENQRDFEQEEAIRASFVSVPKTPTARDESYAEKEIHRIREEVVSGGDFAELAEQYSDDPGSAGKGGDLGFFGRGAMVKTFEDTAFIKNPGELSHPFRTQFGWHIIKVEDRRGQADSPEVKARHILLRVRPGRDTVDSLSLAAEEFHEIATAEGFHTAASRSGQQTNDTGFITAGSFFPLLGNKTSGLVNAFLESQPGTLSPVYHTDQAIHVFVLSEKRPAGVRPFEEVRNQTASRVKQQKKLDLAEKRVRQAIASASQGSALKELAQRHGLRYAQPDAFARTDLVPTIGTKNGFVGKAFALSVNERSDVLLTRNGAYVIKVLERLSSDVEGFEERRLEIARSILDQKRNDVTTVWFTSLRDQAEIQDYRHRFYTEF